MTIDYYDIVLIAFNAFALLAILVYYLSNVFFYKGVPKRVNE